MIGRGGVCAPSERLREGATGVGGLPTADQAELLRQAFEERQTIPAERAVALCGAIPDCDIEVAGENQLGRPSETRNAVEDLVHGTDVAVLPHRRVDAEDSKRLGRPRSTPDLTADDPTIELGNGDAGELCPSEEQPASPSRAPRGAPDEGIARARTKGLARGLLGWATFLPEDDVGGQRPQKA